MISLFRNAHKKQSLFLLLMFIILNTVTISSRILSVLWIGITLIIIYGLEKPYRGNKIKDKAVIRTWAFYMAIIVIMINLIAGVIWGFGKSPYNHSLKGMVINTLVIGSSLVARENIRSYLVKSIHPSRRRIGICIMIAIMIAVQVPYSQMIGIRSAEELMIFSSQRIIPLIIQNILLTYLVIWEGPISAIIYAGLMEGYNWYLPILPNLNWLQSIAISGMLPAILLVIASEKHNVLTKSIRKVEQEKHMVGNIVTMIIAIALIWFTVGVFSYYPSAVATGSMKPGIHPGDVVIVSRIEEPSDIEALKVGDVIQFKRDKLLINHRIIEIIDDKGVTCYRTKGDNNNVADQELVKAEDIKGVIVYVVPKIGLPTILFKGGDADLSGI